MLQLIQIRSALVNNTRCQIWNHDSINQIFSWSLCIILPWTKVTFTVSLMLVKIQSINVEEVFQSISMMNFCMINYFSFSNETDPYSSTAMAENTQTNIAKPLSTFRLQSPFNFFCFKKKLWLRGYIDISNK